MNDALAGVQASTLTNDLNHSEGRLRTAWLPTAAFLGTLAYLAVVIVTHAFFTSPGYDDSYFAAVSRNFAFGRGYAEIYGETVKVFAPETSAGPAVLLPDALLFRIFGNHYWVANFGALLVAFPLLGGCLYLWRTRLRVPVFAIVCIVTAYLVFSSERTADGEAFRFLFLWSHLMGEIPAVSFVLLAATLASIAGPEARLRLLAGGCLALGIYSKLFAVWTLPGFLVLFVYQAHKQRSLKPVAAFAAGGVATVLVVELFRLMELGSPGDYLDNIRGTVTFYRDWDKGLTDTSGLRSGLQAMDLSALLILPLLAWSAAVLFEQLRNPPPDAAGLARFHVSLILLAGSALHLLWWWRINDAGWIRHLVPAMLYAAVALGMMGSLSKSRLLQGAGLAAFVLVLVPQLEVVDELVPKTGREERLVSLLHVSEFVRAENDGHTSFWGCGWWANRDVYLVADVRMYDCADHESVTAHLAAGERLLQVRSEFYNWEGNADFATLAEDCDKRALFREGAFVVCDATPYLAAREVGPSVAR